MEILSPSPPPSPGPASASASGSGSAMDSFIHRGAGWHFPRRDNVDARVHVAVGRSPEKTLGLLRWAFRRFACAQVVLVHVHQPSPLIPTLLGKIPAAQATEELVLSHRKSEKDEMNKILLTYLTFCHRAQVQASLLVTENEQIHDGIITLVKDHGITKLVMGSTPDTCFKLKASYGKASFMARNAPSFCEIWFVWRGRHIWTREAAAAIGNNISVYNEDDVMIRKRIRFSSTSNNAESILDEGYISYEAQTPADRYEITISDNGQPNDYESLVDANHFCNIIVPNLQHAQSAFNSTFQPGSSVDMESLVLYPQEILDKNFKQVILEAERSRKDAFVELLKRKDTESRVAGVIARAKASEFAQKQEMKMREELEALLTATKKQHEDLAENKEKATEGLDSSMRKLAILDARAKSIAFRMNEAVAELKLIQSSIGTLNQEIPKREKLELVHTDQVERCAYNHIMLPNCSSTVCADDLYNFRELTLSDIKAATCKFSDSLKVQPRGLGCVYKGEIMNRSVMIYKLHSCIIQSSMQFQQEVHLISKVRHPHLVTLIGACPDALCLVYEYVPNGSLHDRLWSKCGIPQLPWKIRARIVAEISSALFFLHSCKPQMIVHGDLKLENILLDANLHCKIADCGISQLFMEDAKDADPEYRRSKPLTPKSDIYSFGIVILQLLTGKQAAGLPSEVRRAMSSGKLWSLLDPTAGEWPLEVARRLAELGLKCSEAASPELLTPETVRDLEQLHLMRDNRQVPSFFLCPILKEVMHDPQVGADGLTYEGRAISELMDNGPPITPNHALRFAIHDWLSQRSTPF
ncbi:U-box domain-containing protein 33-like isoform X1 [Oryza glaberrima]|uniref:RING-type E3 ubiquitin transferase n=1 Tax=Oryza glaberrima TaxID=4538 RepID=I1QS20_ORYGL|nr:U-box domain-containing protein 33-like isoform X1 [Oryza glaberrima]